MEADYYLVSGKEQFELVNIAFAKAEFTKALEKANKADSLVKTSITQAKVDEIKEWIAKCDSTIHAKSNTTGASKSEVPKGLSNGQKKTSKSGSTASPKEIIANDKKENSVGRSLKPKGEEKKDENNADKYWAKYRDRISVYRKFKGSRDEAYNIIASAPRSNNGALIRPLNQENTKILDAVYRAKLK